jgi:hypothetical protein
MRRPPSARAPRPSAASASFPVAVGPWATKILTTTLSTRNTGCTWIISTPIPYVSPCAVYIRVSLPTAGGCTTDGSPSDSSRRAPPDNRCAAAASGNTQRMSWTCHTAAAASSAVHSFLPVKLHPFAFSTAGRSRAVVQSPSCRRARQVPAPANTTLEARLVGGPRRPREGRPREQQRQRERAHRNQAHPDAIYGSSPSIVRLPPGNVKVCAGTRRSGGCCASPPCWSPSSTPPARSPGSLSPKVRACGVVAAGPRVVRQVPRPARQLRRVGCGLPSDVSSRVSGSSDATTCTCSRPHALRPRA